jgi:hypothetical protein
MKRLLFLVSVAFATSIMAALGDEMPFYQKRGYTLEQVPDASRAEILENLSSYLEFKRMRGLKRSCEAIYQLTDSTGQSVGYGSMCKTNHENERGFFCWDTEGKYFAYSRERYGTAAPGWVGNRILHGCGGGLVTRTNYGGYVTEVDMSDAVSEWPLPELGRGKQRPVLTMLESDIERLGFDIPISKCYKTRYIWLGADKNTAYGAICNIDETGTKALICFDNLVGHFALFTRYQDTSKWVEHTIYGYCWGG